MSFRSIGVLADEVLRKSELAARGHDGAHKFRGEPSGVAQLPDAPTTGGIELGGGLPTGSVNNPPDARADKGGTASELNGKGRGTVKATASWGRAVKMPAHGGIAPTSHTAHLRLVIDNGMRGAPRRQNRAYPSPASRSPLVIVGGTHYTTSGSF